MKLSFIDLKSIFYNILYRYTHLSFLHVVAIDSETHEFSHIILSTDGFDVELYIFIDIDLHIELLGARPRRTCLTKMRTIERHPFYVPYNLLGTFTTSCIYYTIIIY